MAEWAEICAIEPRLADLEMTAKKLGPEYTYRNYENVKRWLNQYAGWDAEKPKLRTSEAWRIAFEHTALHCAP